MIKGLFMALLMASGQLVHCILYGKDATERKDSRTLFGYALLNMAWIVVLLGAIFGGEILILQIICIILSIAYPVILAILGIKRRNNTNQSNMCINEQEGESVPPSKHKEVGKEPIVLSRVRSFILSHKKAILILTIVNLVLFIASLITYAALGTHMSKLADHYYETRVCIEFLEIYEFGCGMISCPYCEGTVVRNYNPGRGIYSIEKYSRISDVRAMFEVFCVVFALLAIIGSTSLIIDYVNRHKGSLETDTTQTSLHNAIIEDDK